VKGFCPLASGSKGNCIYVGTEQTKLLIDLGISYKYLLKQLGAINVDMGEIDAILITHEHSDHIQGLARAISVHNIPVLANHETAKGIVEQLGIKPKFKIFSTGDPFDFGDFQISPFSIPHDTLDPVAFTLETGNYKLGFCTDLGFAPPQVHRRLQGCDYLYLEANHQPERVHACARPPIYKERVLSRNGHLSNSDCGRLLKSVHHPGLKHVHLAHLSSECNTPETAMSEVRAVLEEHGIHVEVCVAPQDKISKAIFFGS
jgi:phosphoribosyl 1,2-cyclic phosphodiesterase